MATRMRQRVVWFAGITTTPRNKLLFLPRGEQVDIILGRLAA